MLTQLQNDLTQPVTKLAWRLREIADVTGFSVQFLRKMDRMGVLKTRIIGRCKIVMTDDLAEFLKGNGHNKSDEDV